MNLAATMTLKTAGFVNPLRGAEAAMSGFKTSLAGLGSLLGAFGVSFAAFKGAEGFVGAIKSVAESGRELRTMSATTGTSIRDLVTLRKTFEEVGIGADGVQPALVKMQAALGGVNEEGQPTAHIFEQLGLKIAALKKLGTVEQLEAISGAVNKLGTQSEKAAAVRGIFGRGGAEMLAIFANPEALKQAQKDYAELGAVMEKNAPAFAHLAITMEKFGAKVKGIFAGLTAEIAPQLDLLLTKVKNSFDSIKLGEKIGDLLTAGFEAAKADRLGEIIGLGIAAGLEKVTPRIKEILNGPLNEWSAGVQARLEVLGVSGNGTFLASAAIAKLKGKSLDQQTEERRQAILQERKNAPSEAPMHEAQDAFAQALAPFLDSARKARESAKKELGVIEPAKKPAGGVSDFSLTGTAAAKITEGDRFTKIGAFIGRGGAQGDYARRTADNTKGILNWQSKIFTTLNTKLSGNGPLLWAP